MSSSNDLHRVVSHGRGGAGNMGEDNSDFSEDQIHVPHLTSPVYTTGRGGTGNMAENDPVHPEYARAAQDVDIIPPGPPAGEFHGGRGGAGNVLRGEEEEARLRALKAEEEAAAQARAARPPPVDHSKIDYRGWADKGKDMLFRRSKNHH